MYRPPDSEAKGADRSKSSGSYFDLYKAKVKKMKEAGLNAKPNALSMNSAPSTGRQSYATTLAPASQPSPRREPVVAMQPSGYSSEPLQQTKVSCSKCIFINFW